MFKVLYFRYYMERESHLAELSLKAIPKTPGTGVKLMLDAAEE